MSMIPIASTTVTAGSTTSIAFSSIPSTFTHLQFRIFSQDAGTTDSQTRVLTMRFNSDSGNNYFYHSLDGNGATASSSAVTSTSYLAGSVSREAGTGTNVNIFAVGILNILDYANTNKNKTVRSLTGVDMNGSGVASLYSGAWNSTNAINNVTFYLRGTLNGVFSIGSRIDLYGITNSPATGA